MKMIVMFFFIVLGMVLPFLLLFFIVGPTADVFVVSTFVVRVEIATFSNFPVGWWAEL